MKVSPRECATCGGTGVAPWESLTLPQRREWSAGVLPNLVPCPECSA